MEAALKAACEVPLAIMQRCCEAIELMEGFAAKGSKIAVSDAGVGAALCRAALEGASLNVFINTKAMKDRAAAAAFDAKANALLGEFVPRAQATFDAVSAQLRGQALKPKPNAKTRRRYDIQKSAALRRKYSLRVLASSRWNRFVFIARKEHRNAPDP